MRILITSDWYRPVINGVVVSQENLMAGLEEAGHEVKLLNPSATRDTYIEGNEIHIGSVSVEKIYPYARFCTAKTGKIVKELIAWKPDVIHVQTEFSTFSIAKKIAKAVGCPMILTYHTVYEDFTHYFCPSVKMGKKMVKSFTRSVIKKMDHVIVPTRKTKDLLLRYGVNKPISVIPTGLNLDQYSALPEKDERGAMRLKYGFTNDDTVLVFLGRLAKEKNVSELIDYYSRFKDKETKLFLVGDGPYRAELEREAQERGVSDRVVFAGMVPPSDVAIYYSLGDIFLTASLSETQGLTYIEAMASSLPLLCRFDPCLEGVIEDGVNGFAYKSEEEFQDRLNTLQEDKEIREKMGRASRTAAFEKFSKKGFAASVEAVYQSVIKD